MKIAVVLPNWVGDAVMATPTLRAIRQHFADAEIVGVVRPAIAEVLAGLSFLDRQIVAPVESATRFKKVSGTVVRSRAPTEGWSRAVPATVPDTFLNLLGVLSLARSLRRERFDLAVLLPNSFRTALLAWLAGAKQRIGFARDARGWLLTDPIRPKPRHQPHPVLDEYLRIAERLGCTDLSRTIQLDTTSDEEQRLAAFWDRHGNGLSWRKVVCLNPGGAFGAAKHWPTQYFGELASRIASELDRTVLVLCGPAERNEARTIVTVAHHPRVVSLADASPSIGLTKAAIRLSELLVTTDSGPRHFAPAFNVPVITLFGPTHIGWSETNYARGVHLQVPVDCGPCQQRECPLGHHRCMKDLTVARVFAEVSRLLAPPTPNVFAA